MNTRTHKRSRSCLAALLVAALLLPACGAFAGAEARPVTNLFGSALTESSDIIQSIARVGEELFIRTNEALYTFSPGDDRVVRRMDMRPIYGPGRFLTGKEAEAEPSASILLSDGDRLLGLDVSKQALFALTLAGDTLTYADPVALDLSAFAQGEEAFRYMEMPAWALVADGRLFLKKQNYAGEPADLYSFDLKTGESRTHQVNHLQAAAPYKDGKLIAARLDPDDSYDPDTGTRRKPELVVFNPADDSLTPLGAQAPGMENSDAVAPLYYDAAEDSLYTFSNTQLLRYDDGLKTRRLVGYLPMFGTPWAESTGGLLTLPDGRMAVAFGNNVFLRGRTEEGLKGVTVLTLAGGLDDTSMLNGILQEMDDVTLQSVEDVGVGYVDAERLAAMFLTNSVKVDLMVLNAYGFDLGKLIDKGYLMDLSQSQTVREYLGSLFPNLSSPVTRGDKIYAIPTQLLLYPLGYYPGNFQAVGLTPPRTFLELLDLVERWATGLGAQHPDYVLFSDTFNVRDFLRGQAIERYIDNRFGAGENLVFDTPEFREVMGRVDSLDYGDLNREIDWEDPESAKLAEELYNKKPLLGFGMGYEPRYMTGLNNSGDMFQLPLVLPMANPDGPAFVQADLALLAVMSTTAAPDAALRFTEHFVGRISRVDRAAMSPDQTETIPNPDYEKALRQFGKNLEEARQRAESLEGAMKSNAEQDVKYMEEQYGRLKETLRNLVTAEDLEWMHGLISRVYVMDGRMNVQRMALLGDERLLQQYYDGVYSLDEFIRRADGKMRLVNLEYQ